MSIYTRAGDFGITSLIEENSVSKADERIDFIGNVDELDSYIGFSKVIGDEKIKEKLSSIQKTLHIIMAGVADPKNKSYKIEEKQILDMEKEIDEIEYSFSRKKEFVLYGECEISARLDIARTVTRRVERKFVKMSSSFKVDLKALQYVNRLSDYLYILARKEEYKEETKVKKITKRG